MLKIKNIIILLTISMVIASCSQYSKVLNKGTSAEQLTMATNLYEVGKFSKAIQLFEKLMSDFQGKPQMERIQYMVSDSYFNTKDYLLSAYHFERFIKNYPRSSKKEDATFLIAMSYYLSTPRSSLDQSETQNAINAFQKFIDRYPNSERVKEANQYIKTLQNKLEKKDFDIAYNYYHTEQFKAAVVAFDNFLSDNLGSVYKEDAMYYKSKSAFELAVRSVADKKETRIKDALLSLDRLERNFKNSKYKTDIANMKKVLNNELNAMTTKS